MAGGRMQGLLVDFLEFLYGEHACVAFAVAEMPTIPKKHGKGMDVGYKLMGASYTACCFHIPAKVSCASSQIEGVGCVALPVRLQASILSSRVGQCRLGMC
jgi:hypothetical protein